MKWRALLTLATTDLPPILGQSHTRQPFVKACEPAKMTCAFMSRGANYVRNSERNIILAEQRISSNAHHVSFH